jgi:hypothetical protein
VARPTIYWNLGLFLGDVPVTLSLDSTHLIG